MADDTSAALIAQLDVKFDTLASNMKKAITVFDNGGQALEKRQAQIRKNLSNWAIDFTGLGGINKALVGLTGAAVIGGIGDLVKKGLDAAEAIGDVAKQAGVSVEFLQEMRFAASQSGASFDVMDEALTTLNKNLGDFVNTGAGRGAAAFKQLGLDKAINAGDVRNAEQAFDFITTGVQKFGSEAQKSSLLAGAFGKEAGPKLLQLVEQGAAGLAALKAEALSLGIVLSTQTIEGAKEANDKLTALFQVIKAEGISAVANLAPEIANLAKQITDGLPDLITWVEKWSAFFGLINLSPVQQANVAIQGLTSSLATLQKQRADAANNPTGFAALFGPSLGEFDTLIAAEKDKLAKAKADLAAAQKSIVDAPKPVARPDPKLTVAKTPEEIAAEKAAQAARLSGAETVARTETDAKTAAAALVAAQNQTSVQLLKGSDAYQAAVQKQIDDEYNAKVDLANSEEAQQQSALDKQRQELANRGVQWQGYATAVLNINDAMNAKIAAADEERKQKQFENSPQAIIQGANEQGRQQIQQFQDETAAVGLDAGALAKLVFQQQALAEARARQIPITAELITAIDKEGDAVGVAAKQAHDAQQNLRDSIQVTDEFRTGLEDVGVAGLHGFDSLADAARTFIGELADMIFRLGVLRPLLNGLFGEQGTLGSGPIGGAFSSDGGFFNSIANLFGAGNLAQNTTAAIAANPLLFAKGGVFVPGMGSKPLKRFAGGGMSNGAAIFGEAGPEAAVPLPDGRSIPVSLRVPRAPQVQAARPSVQQYFNVDARYATKGVSEEVHDQLIALAPVMTKAAVEMSRKEFPSNLSNTLRDRA